MCSKRFQNPERIMAIVSLFLSTGANDASEKVTHSRNGSAGVIFNLSFSVYLHLLMLLTFNIDINIYK